jgi:hypothetical protein
VASAPIRQCQYAPVLYTYQEGRVRKIPERHSADILSCSGNGIASGCAHAHPATGSPQGTGPTRRSFSRTKVVRYSGCFRTRTICNTSLLDHEKTSTCSAACDGTVRASYDA